MGSLLNDGGGSALITALSATNGTPNSNNIIRNIPYDNHQTNLGLSADYRINSLSSFNASYEREDVHREDRERPDTWEDKLKIGYVNRSLGDGTLRLSAETDHKRGEPYDSTGAYTSSSASHCRCSGPRPPSPPPTTCSSWRICASSTSPTATRTFSMPASITRCGPISTWDSRPR